MPSITSGGTRIAYEEAGTGDPALVLIHGWACNRSYLRRQFDHFSPNHHTVAMDLKGHGDSDAPQGDYSVEALATDVAALIEEVGLDRPVLVGHSLGGLVALMTACRRPDLVRKVVTLDSPVLLSPRGRASLTALVDELAGDDCVAAARAFVASMFLPGDDPSVKEATISSMSSTRPHVMTEAMRGLTTWEGEDVLATCAPPVLVISAGWRPDGRRLQELHGDLETGETVGAGHFHQLLVPDQVNAMIERFLQL